MNLGAGELVLLAIFALLIFGPKRLPDIGRQVGRAIAEVRRVSREFEREVRDVTEPFEKEVRDAERLARQRYTLDENLSTFTGPTKKDGKTSDPPATDGVESSSSADGTTSVDGTTSKDEPQER